MTPGSRLSKAAAAAWGSLTLNAPGGWRDHRRAAAVRPGTVIYVDCTVLEIPVFDGDDAKREAFLAARASRARSSSGPVADRGSIGDVT